jgi:glyoxalase family protein
VHHVGVRVRDERALSLWQERLATYVDTVGEVQERLYYRSITVEEPGGVRIDLATDGPGVTVDEDPTRLGTHLALPPWLEAWRTHLARVLPPLHLRSATSREDVS